MLAGIPVTDDDTEPLAELLRHAEFTDTAEALERALAMGTKVVALGGLCFEWGDVSPR